MTGDLPSQRGETWNDTEAIERHRSLSPSQRVGLAIEVSRATLRFAHAPKEPSFAPEKIVAALNAGDVAHVIVGDLASAAHGVVRATDTLDLVPEPSAENLDRLAAALTDLGAEHRIDGRPTGASLARPVSVELRTRHGDVQVVNRMPAVPPYAELVAAANSADLADETPALICSLADLRAMKLASGRPRDVVDVAELDELHGR